MAAPDWEALLYRARVYMAQTPGFLPLRYVETFHLHGGLPGFMLFSGSNLATLEGRMAANFQVALYLVSMEVVMQGAGGRRYLPTPFRGIADEFHPEQDQIEENN
jgi:hypothetical protein